MQEMVADKVVLDCVVAALQTHTKSSSVLDAGTRLLWNMLKSVPTATEEVAFKARPVLEAAASTFSDTPEADLCHFLLSILQSGSQSDVSTADSHEKDRCEVQVSNDGDDEEVDDVIVLSGEPSARIMQPS